MTIIYNICIIFYSESMIQEVGETAPYADMARFYAITITRPGTSRYGPALHDGDE